MKSKEFPLWFAESIEKNCSDAENRKSIEHARLKQGNQIYFLDTATAFESLTERCTRTLFINVSIIVPPVRSTVNPHELEGQQ